MWRTIFIALGIVLLIFGVEFLIVDKATWARDEDTPQIAQRPQSFGVQGSSSSMFNRIQDESNKNPEEFEPANWVPWAMLSSGAIIILYSITLPRRGLVSGGDG